MDAERVLRRFWDRMATIYGHRWSTSYGPDARTAGQDWGEALASMTLDQIKRGIDACRDGHGPSDGWPPTLPQFRELCIGLPPIAEVRRELASRDGRRTPFGLLVSQRLDSWEYRQAREDRAERMLREAYAEARSHVMAGGELPPVFAAIPDDTDREPAPATPEVAAAALAAVREMLDGAPPVLWRERGGLWAAALPISGGREARATVMPPQAEGQPWRWRVMIAGDVAASGAEADGEAAKEAAARWAAASVTSCPPA